MSAIDSSAMTDRDLIKWWRASWTHRLVAWAVIVLTLSLAVQILATVFLAH